MRSNIVTITVVAIFLVTVSSSAGFDFLTTGGNGLGQTVILSKSSASTLLLVPSGGHTDRQWKVEFAAARRFELKDLDQTYLAVAYRFSSLTYSAGFTSFGYGDFYAERTGRLAVAYHLDSLIVGANVSYMQVDFGGHYENLSGQAVGLGATYRAGRVLASVVAENINSPRLDSHSERLLPKYSLYTELIGPGSYAITGRVTGQKWEKPQFGVGQKIDISSISSIFWGLSTGPFIYGGGLELIYKRSIITYATSYHPTLGFSHTLSLSFGFGKDDPQQR